MSKGGEQKAETSSGTLRDELADRFQIPLKRYFARRVGPNDSEDLVQEVFTRVLRRGDCDDVENAEAFVFTAARNLLRDRARRQEVQGRWLSNEPPPELESEVLSPERVLQGEEALKAILSELDDMSEKTRDIFILNRLEGLKYREIADQYGISISAVEKHMIKALARLSKTIAKGK